MRSSQEVQSSLSQLGIDSLASKPDALDVCLSVKVSGICFFRNLNVITVKGYCKINFNL